ncbi:MAG: hypothetical protein ABH840_01500 [Nanoarchaeota archaeon]
MEAKRGMILLLLFLILPFASAEIIINQQPDNIYNLGDVATIGITLKPIQTITGNFQMDLLCGANAINFYKNGMNIPAGDERVIESSLVLQKDIIGESKGTCKIKAYFISDFALTNDFLISDLINVNSTLSKKEFGPGETILVKGTAIKENEKASNGYLELILLDGNLSVTNQKGTVNNGAFSTNITLPKDTKSGTYILQVFAYEEDLSGITINTGSFNNEIFVKQIPTSLEIVFEQLDPEIEISPGKTLRVKAVLHDQTGVSIGTLVFLTIKNENNKIMEQTELSTDEFLEFPIAYNEPPSTWKIVAVSNKLTSESSFSIPEKESAEIKIENKTILITNTGNIPYNKTVLVKIGNQSLNIDVYLKVDQSQRWLLTAPDGEYDVSVISDSESIDSNIALTGNAINIRKASAGIGSLTKFPAIWIFMIAVLGIMTFIVFKRGYQKAFIGYITRGKKQNKSSETADTFTSNSKGKAEMVLSIKGDKQETSMITLKIKNMAWVKNMKEGNASEVIEKLVNLAENNKAVTYKTSDYVFFILAPSKTKTFKNETSALKIAQTIKETLDHHNKMFKQKIDFGISLNVGEIIAKQDSESFKFMGLGPLIIQSKKIASVADKDILMGEKMNDRVKTIVKAEKHKHEGIDTYAIKEIKDHEKHEKFLKGFMKRQGENK